MSLLVYVTSVHAHDPGLSKARLQWQGESIVMSMVFSRQDMEWLTPIDSNHDGIVSVGEWQQAEQQLLILIRQGVKLKQSNEVLEVAFVDVRKSADDTISIELKYSRPTVAASYFSLSLLNELPRGHRQHLSVYDESDELLARQIIKADSAPVLLQRSHVEGSNGVFLEYLIEGVWHIWAGFDHILFLLTLLLPAVLIYQKDWYPAEKLRPVIFDTLKVVTAFTLAHSITLALATLHIVTLPSNWVESVIALSVLVTAINNLRPFFPAARWLLAFGFGLVHGFGFATVLGDLGLPDQSLISALLSFNLGVELGQLAIIGMVFPVAAWLRHSLFYKTWLLQGGSTIAALVAVVWMAERMFGYQVLGF